MAANCFSCRHREEVAGNCHIKCAKGGADSRMYGNGLIITSVLIQPQYNGVRDDVELKGNGWSVRVSPHGIRNGWCMFPILFDPTWVSSCDGFCNKEYTLIS